MRKKAHPERMGGGVPPGSERPKEPASGAVAVIFPVTTSWGEVLIQRSPVSEIGHHTSQLPVCRVPCARHPAHATGCRVPGTRHTPPAAVRLPPGGGPAWPACGRRPGPRRHGGLHPRAPPAARVDRHAGQRRRGGRPRRQRGPGCPALCPGLRLRAPASPGAIAVGCWGTSCRVLACPPRLFYGASCALIIGGAAVQALAITVPRLENIVQIVQARLSFSVGSVHCRIKTMFVCSGLDVSGLAYAGSVWLCQA